MVFPERNIKNYALKKKAFSKGLTAVTLCSFVKDNPDDTSGEFQCPYSYAVNGSDNEMSFCTSPTLRVIINGEKRFVYLYWCEIVSIVIAVESPGASLCRTEITRYGLQDSGRLLQCSDSF